ncbi:hypothetical protein JX266_014298 [Neoarthrinium moseri]|nr:hypothetical protein JX266_014298 [Neoarthrinium moseri]
MARRCLRGPDAWLHKSVFSAWRILAQQREPPAVAMRPQDRPVLTCAEMEKVHLSSDQKEGCLDVEFLPRDDLKPNETDPQGGQSPWGCNCPRGLIWRRHGRLHVADYSHWGVIGWQLGPQVLRAVIRLQFVAESRRPNRNSFWSLSRWTELIAGRVPFCSFVGPLASLARESQWAFLATNASAALVYTSVLGLATRRAAGLDSQLERRKWRH